MGKASSLISLILAMMCLGACHKWMSEDDIKQMQVEAEPIIEALDKFHIDHQNYPGKLEDLVPDYLEEIKQPTVGEKKWGYRVSDNFTERHEYSLFLREKGYEDSYEGYYFSHTFGKETFGWSSDH